MKIRFALFLFLLAFFAFFVGGQSKPEAGQDWVEFPAVSESLCVNNLFQSNMVIQRDKPVRVWGWASPGEKVTVSFGGQTKSAVADQGRSWKVTLAAMAANSTPQIMKITGKKSILTFENILIGDVWILGGQSNMEMALGRIEEGGWKSSLPISMASGT